MNNFKLSFVLIFIVSLENCFAQFSDEIIISDSEDGAWTVTSADLNGDGLEDVLSANRFGDDLGWFQNNSENIFLGSQLISEIGEPLDILAADFNGDTFIDVIATAPFDDMVLWYKNLDNDGSFSDALIISMTAIGANNVQVTDIDQDGDLDVFIAADA